MYMSNNNKYKFIVQGGWNESRIIKWRGSKKPI